MSFVTYECKDCDGEGGHYDERSHLGHRNKCDSCNGIGHVASITINGLICKITLELLEEN
jgi:DnaJ-class molecular chaperone